jgi:hypothetical protein
MNRIEKDEKLTKMIASSTNSNNMNQIWAPEKSSVSKEDLKRLAKSLFQTQS